MDNSKDHYAQLTLLCRMLDLLNLVEYASSPEGLLIGEKIRAKEYADELRGIYGERRYLPPTHAVGVNE